MVGRFFKDPIDRLTEQTEFDAIYNQYVSAYRQLDPGQKHWSLNPNFLIIRAVDGAGVYFVPESGLNGGKSDRVKFAPIAKSIGHRLLDCAAFFLASNTPVNAVPDTLRLNLSVCHSLAHWTATIVDIPAFKSAYAKLVSLVPANKRYESINEAKNDIYKAMGIVLEHPGPGERVPTENEKMQIIVKFFSHEQRLLVRHYDSMNSDSYHNGVSEGMEIIAPQADYQPLPCSPQRGMTCGDHTLINLFMVGVMNKLPVINGNTGVTSRDLRQFTDDVKANKVAEGSALTLICNLQKDVNDKTGLTEIVKSTNVTLVAIAKVVNALIDDLRKENNAEFTTNVMLAISAAKEEVIDPSTQTKVSQELINLFQGKHEIFGKVNVAEEDKIAFGVYAEIIAIDIVKDIEARELQRWENQKRRLEEDRQREVARKQLEERKQEEARKREELRKLEEIKKQDSMRKIAEPRQEAARKQEERKHDEAPKPSGNPSPVRVGFMDAIKQKKEEKRLRKEAEKAAKAQAAETERLQEKAQQEEAIAKKLAETLKAADEARELAVKKLKEERKVKLLEHVLEILKDSTNKIPFAVITAFQKDAQMNDWIIAAVEANPNSLTLNNVKRLLALYNFVTTKQAAIDELTPSDETKRYTKNLNDFHQASIKILLAPHSDPIKKQDLTLLAEDSFKHTRPGLRLFADFMMVLSCVILVGFAIGGYRLYNNKTLFFSSNTAVKQVKQLATHCRM